MTLDKIFPPAARARFWRLLEWPQRYRFRRHLAKYPVAPRRNRPALNYADATRSDGAGLLHGGRVKLLHLSEIFPEKSDFNVLYLVSSAPPRFPLDLVKWAKRRGVKLAWNQNGVAYPAWYGDCAEELNGPMRELRAQADYVFYQSAFCRECADRFLGTVDAPSEIAFNCVDTTVFQPAEPPATETCQIVAAGSHHDSYRVMSVLETVAELKRRKFPVFLTLAGRLVWPGAEEEMARRIRELGIEAEIWRIAPYRQEDAPAIYQGAHVLIHPKYKDPCPTVPIEAMACGVPVIGSASGGMPELVSADAGVLLEVPESWDKNYWPEPVRMADAVEKIMGRWPQFSAAARANAVARFEKKQWQAQHRRVFERLAAS